MNLDFVASKLVRHYHFIFIFLIELFIIVVIIIIMTEYLYRIKVSVQAQEYIQVKTTIYTYEHFLLGEGRKMQHISKAMKQQRIKETKS